MTTIEVSGGVATSCDRATPDLDQRNPGRRAIGKIDVLRLSTENAVAILNKAPIKKKSYRARAIK